VDCSSAEKPEVYERGGMHSWLPQGLCLLTGCGLWSAHLAWMWAYWEANPNPNWMAWMWAYWEANPKRNWMAWMWAYWEANPKRNWMAWMWAYWEEHEMTTTS
jgi:hypothetical protein